MTQNQMQERQDAGKLELIVQNVADWRDCLQVPTKLNATWAKLCGGSEVPLIDYIRKEAEMNNQSFERSVVAAFLNLGYQLEELEVELSHPEKKAWGRCVWYKDHPSYAQPIDAIYNGSAINNPAFYHAMFKTEHAGDQHTSFYSMQMIASASILPHKTLLYRKVVFSPPKQGATESVAA